MGLTSLKNDLLDVYEKLRSGRIGISEAKQAIGIARQKLLLIEKQLKT